MASIIEIDAPSVPVEQNYAQAIELKDFSRLVFVSGQIPVDKNHQVPKDFQGQAQQVWANINAQLQAADMGIDDLVKVTIFLSSREYSDENRRIRDEILNGRRVALTVIIADIFDENWLLEIEAIAAK